MDAFRTVIGRFGPARAGALGVAGLVMIVILLGVSRWATSPSWVPLVQGQPLERIGAITARLEESKIRYRLSQGGSVIEVDESAAARARVLLAQQGLSGSVSDPGFELFDRPSWGMTEFTQRINYRRALEGELERSIGEMQGVAGARVHLALSERSGMRRDATELAASVVLRLEPGARSSEELVESISSLVASSVGGLRSDKVTVLDDTGRLLGAAVETGLTDNSRKKELSLRRDIEGYLEQRAEELVTQMIGIGNARVRVATDVSFERTERTLQLVDPEQQVTTKEEKTEVVAAGQTEAGTSATSATYETSRRLETSTNPGGEVRRMTVAVVVNASALADPADTRGIESLVANAVGLNRSRGDSISVVAVPFQVAAPSVLADEQGGPGIMEWIEILRRPVLGVLALLLTFVFAMGVMRAVRGALQQAPQHQLTGEVALAALPGAVNAHAALAAPGPPPPLVQSQLTPELASRVLRAWARDA